MINRKVTEKKHEKTIDCVRFLCKRVGTKIAGFEIVLVENFHILIQKNFLQKASTLENFCKTLAWRLEIWPSFILNKLNACLAVEQVLLS